MHTEIPGALESAVAHKELYLHISSMAYVVLNV